MALDKSKLKRDVIEIMHDMMTREKTSIEEFAERLSTAVDVYVKEAEIVYESGLTAPNGPVGGTFKGKLK
ncbi:hypothetical protein QP519_11020 [Weeksella virosa]|uniref:hypothetical protein n=1 Tax=Weeksella virosa TaxID=1014 RepID=UPI0025574061|nr:hypothetical protein [Weeksella virosa]MDK7376063.1 hypothetical protein [Weeksella virosa]MDK7674397.1 hypothetical protein [Weeksella virosa]